MVEDIIRVANRYYILSTSSLADDRTRILKQGELFAVCDRRGDMGLFGPDVQGMYFDDTRFLSRWALFLGGTRPFLLSSAVRDDNASLAVDMTNPDLRSDRRLTVPRGTLHIERFRFLWRGTLYERMRVVNYSVERVDVSFSIEFAADYVDIFEVRGVRRKQRGKYLTPTLTADSVTLGYCGRDGRVRRTCVRCSPKPREISHSKIVFDFPLPPHEERTYSVMVSSEVDDLVSVPTNFDNAAAEAGKALSEAERRGPRVYTGNEQFNDWLNRSTADLRMLTEATPHGAFPYAGVPWFNAPFGRDSIITALETLWITPAIARAVLSFLAATQATEHDPSVDAEPGKILHEMRKGEMATLNEVPFGRYYGSVDSTPLFVMLAGRYYRRTGDLAFLEKLWPNIEAALRWIDLYGDVDGDGFVEYMRRSKTGLVHQGWKDSGDAVFHRDGALAEGPIALCEVQGYVYAAKREAARVATALAKPRLAEELKEQVQNLQQRFEDSFWCDDLNTYAIALDGSKQRCRVLASNAGHCLFTGIARRDRGRLVGQTLFRKGFFSGWGIRTLSSSEVRYNAMSYHNGSVWPHDNALIAKGLARYGMVDRSAAILTGLFDASLFLDLHRLPELFCGFGRRPGEGPTLYPIACAPQAWAAAAVFQILDACMGISIQGVPPLVVFRRTRLPESIPKVQVDDLQVGNASVSFVMHSASDGVDIRVLRKEGSVQIISVK